MKLRCLVIGDLNIDLMMHKFSCYPELGKGILVKDYSLVLGGQGGYSLQFYLN